MMSRNNNAGIIQLLATAMMVLCCFSQRAQAQDGKRSAHLDSLLHRIYREDQAVRHYSLNMEGMDEDSLMAYIQRMTETDLRCQTSVFPILDSLGIPEGLSDTSYSALFLVVQHSDLEHQRKYYPLFEAGAEKGLIEPSDVATMLDRILMHEGKPQVYGTQTFSQMKTIIVKAGENGKPGNSTGTAHTTESANYLWPVENADSLDIHRARVGLPPIGTYIKIFGEMGMTLVWDKDMTAEEATKIKTGQIQEQPIQEK